MCWIIIPSVRCRVSLSSSLSLLFFSCISSCFRAHPVAGWVGPRKLDFSGLGARAAFAQQNGTRKHSSVPGDKVYNNPCVRGEHFEVGFLRLIILHCTQVVWQFIKVRTHCIFQLFFKCILISISSPSVGNYRHFPLRRMSPDKRTSCVFFPSVSWPRLSLLRRIPHLCTKNLVHFTIYKSEQEGGTSNWYDLLVVNWLKVSLKIGLAFKHHSKPRYARIIYR